MRRSAALFAALLLLSACADDDVAQDGDGRLTLGSKEVSEVTERSVGLDGRTLVIGVDAGSITVVGTDEDEARLRFVCVARGATEASARQRLDQMTIDEAGDDEVYQYVARANDLESIRVNVEVHVPREAALNLRLDRGTIRLSGTTGPIDAATENGAIEAAGLAGRQIALKTELGSIDAGFASVPADAEVEIETDNGSLAVTLPPDVDLAVDVETATGDVTVQDLTFGNQNLDEDASGTSFSGRLGTGSAELRARTEVGSITLRGGLSRELSDLDLGAIDDTTVVPVGAPVPPSGPTNG